MSSLTVQQDDVRIEVTWPDGSLPLASFAQAMDHAGALWSDVSGKHRVALKADALTYEVSPLHKELT